MVLSAFGVAELAGTSVLPSAASHGLDRLLLVANAVLVVALVVVSVWRAWKSRHKMRGIPNLLFLNAAAALWCIAAMMADTGTSHGRFELVLLILSATGSATAAMLIAWQITAPTLSPPRALIAVLVAIPALLAAVGIVVIAEPEEAINDATSPIHIAVAAYCTVLVLATLTMLARRYRDEDHLVRRSMPLFQVFILLIFVAGLRDLRLPSVFVGLAALAVMWMSSKASPWISRSLQHERLLDEIGAFVFVFDDEARLTAWNGPSARLMAQTARSSISVGESAQSVLGIDVPFTGRVDLAFDRPEGVLQTQGYTTQSPQPSSQSRWVVVLRPTAAEDKNVSSRAPRQPEQLEINAINEETGALGRASILDRIHRQHESRESIAVIRLELVGAINPDVAGQAMRELVIGLATLRGGIIIGRVERLVLLALLPDPAEATELSAKLRTKFDGLEQKFGASLAATAFSVTKAEDVDEFIRRVLTAQDLVDRVKWQPRWY